MVQIEPYFQIEVDGLALVYHHVYFAAGELGGVAVFEVEAVEDVGLASGYCFVHVCCGEAEFEACFVQELGYSLLRTKHIVNLQLLNTQNRHLKRQEPVARNRLGIRPLSPRGIPRLLELLSKCSLGQQIVKLKYGSSVVVLHVQVVNSVLLGHEFGGVVDEVRENHESPHEHFSDFEIKGRDFVSKRGALVNEAFLVLLIVNFVLFGHHVVVVQLKTLEIILDVKFCGLA